MIAQTVGNLKNPFGKKLTWCSKSETKAIKGRTEQDSG